MSGARARDYLRLRRATVDDAPGLHEIVAAAGRAMAEQGFRNWLSPDATERFVEDITTREVYVIIAEWGQTPFLEWPKQGLTPISEPKWGQTPFFRWGQTPFSGWGQSPTDSELAPIATFTLGASARRPYSPQPWLDLSTPALYLNRLAVDPVLQGAGIGGWCLEQIERLARERGVRAVRCDVLSANARLCRLYERFGYVARGERSHSQWRFACYERVID
jgi:ribosomal protein S18 acetylase RimI-like enzyme